MNIFSYLAVECSCYNILSIKHINKKKWVECSVPFYRLSFDFWALNHGVVLLDVGRGVEQGREKAGDYTLHYTVIFQINGLEEGIYYLLFWHVPTL